MLRMSVTELDFGLPFFFGRWRWDIYTLERGGRKESKVGSDAESCAIHSAGFQLKLESEEGSKLSEMEYNNALSSADFYSYAQEVDWVIAQCLQFKVEECSTMAEATSVYSEITLRTCPLSGINARGGSIWLGDERGLPLHSRTWPVVIPRQAISPAAQRSSDRSGNHQMKLWQQP